MKKILTLKAILLLYITFSTIACNKEPEETTPITPIDTVKIDSVPVWSTPFNINGNLTSYIPSIYKNYVIYNYLYASNFQYFMMDKSTGKQEFLINAKKSHGNFEFKPTIYKQYLIAQYSRNTQIIDLENKVLLNEIVPEQYNSYNYSNNFLLHNKSIVTPISKLIKRFDDNYVNELKLISWNIEDNQRDTLYSNSDTSKYVTYLLLPSLYINKNSDSIFIFKKYYLWFGGTGSGPNSMDDITDIYAYNVTQKKIEWVNKEVSFNDYYSYLSESILISGNTAIFRGRNSLIAFDCETGKEKWSKYYIVNFDKLIIAENKLITSLESAGNVIAYDLETGNLIWDYSQARALTRNFQYHKGYVYFVANYYKDKYGFESRSVIKRVKLSDGKLDWMFFVPNPKKYFQGITIDPETNLLYTNDYEKMFCIRLPEG